MGSPAVGTKAPQLSIRTPNGETQVVTLQQDHYDIGRAESNDLSFRDVLGLSRKHLALDRDGANWTVRDLGSTNGTFVNGTQITAPQVLRPRDRVTAGELTLTFSEGAAPAAQTVIFVEKPPTTSAETTMTTSLDGLLAEEAESSGGGHNKALIRAGRELAGHMPLDKLFDLIMDLSVEAVGASRGVLMTLEDGELQVRASKGAGIRISSHVRDLVINTKRSLLVHDALRDQALGARMSIVQDQIRSMLAVPLQTEKRVIGLIYLDSPFLIREFTKEDLSLLTVMGNIAAIRIEHARLAEMDQAEKLRAQEMQQAAMIQRSILPSNFPPFPDRKEFELHAAMTPARGVGGDLFDFFLLDEDHLAFAVGDVSGKGVPAALFMAVARTLLRATAPHQTSPAECMQYMNASLASQNASGMFVTFFYGVLDTRTGEMQFANAGHNPPLVFTADGTLRTLEDKGGPMLGLFPKLTFEMATTTLAPGEGILVFTDGVTEARNPADEFFEDERLEAYLKAHAAEPVETLVSGLHRYLEEFAAGAPQADDITALALRYLGRH
ncbi:MAG: SpoIIE family protein phosphatase [Acidobacteriia bacterium]|nr:SpoIIE family protein phosphatase [Terriglobia bacterium]